jgi:phosphohistidine phosphatase
LSDRGQIDADAAGFWLRDQGLMADIVIVSPAKRTQETWQRVSAGLAPVNDQFVAAEIYQAYWTELLDLIRAQGSDRRTVVLVGHNPGCSELAERLSGSGSDAQALVTMSWKYRTMGIAVLQFEQEWDSIGPGSGMLSSFVAPRG